MGESDRHPAHNLVTVNSGVQAEVASKMSKQHAMMAAFGYFAWLLTYCFKTEQYVPLPVRWHVKKNHYHRPSCKILAL